ncbi:tyrosine-type recombinase/integrase [Neobacillus sp. NPDC093127]|uniref:tyrosine-type recombinase/integrase n=1 Tax=Neobacillus sp. NPDC093127 TaxID=3364296 RepID=UPI0038263B8F
MDNTNLNQNFVEHSSSKNILDLRCGNSKFKDDVWDFAGYVEGAENWRPSDLKLDFTSFSSWDSIKHTIKLFIHSEFLNCGFSSVFRKLVALKKLKPFLEKKKHITSFSNFTKTVVADFFSYLFEATTVLGEPLSGVSIRHCAHAVKEILTRGSVRGWDVPKETFYLDALYKEKILKNKRVLKHEKTSKIIPEEETVNKIIKCAQVDEDVLCGTAIILSTQLSLRLSEVFSIEEGCLSIKNGDYYITYITSKTKNERVPVTVPANELVVNAVKRLEKETKNLREESGLTKLFLKRLGKKIVIPNRNTWSKRLFEFCLKNDIRDKDGEVLKLTHHYFRHICITYALKGGMSITDAAELANHSSIKMTLIYDHSKEEKQQIVRDILTGKMPVATTNKVVLQNLESPNNPYRFKGKTLSDEQVEKLSKALKIEVLPHGVCMHHPLKNEPCAQDGVCLGCNYFLACSNKLPLYKARIEKIDKQLEKEQGENIFKSKLQFNRDKLSYYINELEKKNKNTLGDRYE